MLNSRKFSHQAAILSLGALLLIGLPGCGDDDEDGSNGAATPTASPSPTPTEEPGPPHSIMRVGSTEVGSGKLAVNVDPIPTSFVVPTACLGGTGDDCTGGIVVYSGTSPGFNDLRDTDAMPPFRLPDGIEVRIELTAVDADASLGISGVTIDAPGESALVNTTGELHNHPMWQMVAPGGGPHPEAKEISFRLHANGFTSSDVFTVRIEVFEGQDGGEHD